MEAIGRKWLWARARGRGRASCIALLAVLIAIGPGLVAATAVEPPATKLDCSVYETKSMNVSAAFTVAQFIFNIIPSI